MTPGMTPREFLLLPRFRSSQALPVLGRNTKAPRPPIALPESTARVGTRGLSGRESKREAQLPRPGTKTEACGGRGATLGTQAL